MLDKRILPESFDFGVPSVDIIDASRALGLDKKAMGKRASAFDDILDNLEVKPNRTYLHVITTGAMEKYGANRNADAFNETACEHTCPHPENGAPKTIKLGGGLKEYHDKSYMDKKAGVYQEHNTKDTAPSGEIIAAKYNDDMHRGELLIAVDTEKWAPRLQKKASGENIYLSMGCVVPHDLCSVCHRMAKTAKEHCDHFKYMRTTTLDDGTQVSVINDRPSFYDISGVDVPADRIAYVLRKVASGDMAKTASAEALAALGSRSPMLFTKAARLLSKLAEMEKQIEVMVEGDKDKDNDDVFRDDEDKEKDFILRVENYPADEVIDLSSRKGILLSPGMLFKLMGKECPDDGDRKTLEDCDDDSCGDCSAMMRELDDDEGRNSMLLDGTFDQRMPVDLSLANILESFIPDFGMTSPAVGSRSIHIVIIGGKPKERQKKEASYRHEAETALRRMYARYFLSFAERNDDATCRNALRKIARYGK